MPKRTLGRTKNRGSLRKVCGRVCLRKGCGRDLLDSFKLNNIKQILVDAFKCKVAEAVQAVWYCLISLVLKTGQFALLFCHWLALFVLFALTLPLFFGASKLRPQSPTWPIWPSWAWEKGRDRRFLRLWGLNIGLTISIQSIKMLSILQILHTCLCHFLLQKYSRYNSKLQAWWFWCTPTENWHHRLAASCLAALSARRVKNRFTRPSWTQASDL